MQGTAGRDDVRTFDRVVPGGGHEVEGGRPHQRVLDMDEEAPPATCPLDRKGYRDTLAAAADQDVRPRWGEAVAPAPERAERERPPAGRKGEPRQARLDALHDRCQPKRLGEPAALTFHAGRTLGNDPAAWPCHGTPDKGGALWRAGRKAGKGRLALAIIFLCRWS